MADSLREDLDSAFEGETETVDTTATQVAEAAVTETVETEEQASEGRVRDPATGRFVPKGEQAQEVEQAQTEQKTEQPTEQPKEQVVEQTGVDLPPSTFTAAAKAAYMSLPADSPLRQDIKKREADFQKGITQYKQAAEYGNRVMAEFQPYMQTIQERGGQPLGVLRNLLQTAHVLNTAGPEQKAQLLLQVAQQYGVDLSQHFGQPQGEQAAFDPRTLTPVVQQLLRPALQEINQFKTQFLTAQQQAEAQQQQEIQGQIEAFRTATDEKGQPKHVYFDNVRELMGSFLESGYARDMDDAYVMACRAHPEVSQTVSAAQRRSEDAQRLEEARRKANDAKRAGSVNVTGQGGVGIADTSKNSLRDDLLQAFEGTERV